MTASLSETRASGDWSFDLRGQTIATPRVTTDIGQETSSPSAGATRLRAVFDADQAEVWFQAASKLGAATVQQVSGGPNVVTDPTNGTTTVTVTTPDDAQPVPDGDYVIRDWQAEWAADEYIVKMTLYKT